jgi:hypothetical protein
MNTEKVQTISNAPTVRIENMIENGLYIHNHSFIRATKEMDIEHGIYYLLSYHESDYSPQYASETFDDIQALANAMKQLADLRTWRKMVWDY